MSAFDSHGTSAHRTNGVAASSAGYGFLLARGQRVLRGWLMACGMLLAGVVACHDDPTVDASGVDEAVDPASGAAPAEVRKPGWSDLDLIDYVPPPAAKLGTEEREGTPLTREELAEALRPVLSTPLGTKMAREPNWSGADAVLKSGQQVLAYHPGETSTDPVGISAVIGADGRSRVTPTTVAPFSSMVQLKIFADGGWGQCTGTYVGPWTVLTAAHCLRQSDGSVAPRITFNPARDGSVLPYGSFACVNDDAVGGNNYLAAIPAAYASSADPNFDFAVIDTYPCHVAARWLGMPASNAGIWVNAGNTTYSMHGYPAMRCPGAPAGWDYLCGMSGPAYLNGNWVETEHIDTSGGQSGGPWHFGGRVAATHIGYREYFDLFRCGFDVCRRNYGRRIDGVFKQFIDQNSFDYP